MSHWLRAEAKGLVCSLDILEKAMKRAMPAWANAIEVYPDGIDVPGYGGDTINTVKAYLVVRKSKITDSKAAIKYTDFAWFKEGKTWATFRDNMSGSLPIPFDQLVVTLKKETGREKYLREAKRRGYMVQESGGKTYITAPTKAKVAQTA